MNWVNAIAQGILLGGLYALFACGLSLMFGVMRVVNLAHGDFAVLAAYLALAAITGLHVPVLWSALILPPLLVTFVLSIVLQTAMLEPFSADSHSLPSGSLASGSFQLTSQLSIGHL